MARWTQQTARTFRRKAQKSVQRDDICPVSNRNHISSNCSVPNSRWSGTFLMSQLDSCFTIRIFVHASCHIWRVGWQIHHQLYFFVPLSQQFWNYKMMVCMMLTTIPLNVRLCNVGYFSPWWGWSIARSLMTSTSRVVQFGSTRNVQWDEAKRISRYVYDS
jgi:hypothetical protein